MVLSLLYGFREFLSRDEIGKLAVESDRSSPDYSPRTLLIFSTSKQRTWLVTTEKSLVCVLDDVRKDAPTIRWTMPLDEARNAQIEIRARADSERTGLLDIGPRRNWLLSKHLFQEVDPSSAVRNFVANN